MDKASKMDIEKYNEPFPKNLRWLIENVKIDSKRVTQEMVAKSVGTKRQTISQYADGTVNPTIDKLEKIARYFNVSADWLLGINSQSLEIGDKAISLALGLTGEAITLLRLANDLAQNSEKWKAAVNIIMEIDNSDTIDKIEKYFKQNSVISKAQTILDSVNAMPRIYVDFIIGHKDIIQEIKSIIDIAYNGGQK